MERLRRSLEDLAMTRGDHWSGRKVFITGHTGFKGGWLSLWLRALDAKVCGYSLDPPTAPNLFAVLGLERQIAHVPGDVRDHEHLAAAMKSFSPDVVFHLAAQPLVRTSYAQPRLTYETNVMGTLNVYEAVRQCESVRAVVTITTDKCYENREWVWGYRESDPMGGYDPYSSSKACAEILSSAYRKSFFDGARGRSPRLATARAGNVIGGGDWADDRLIPDCIRALAASQPIRIRQPRAIRPWQHVLEPLSGYLLLADRLLQGQDEFAQGWNFGPGSDSALEVMEVANLVVRFWGSGECFVQESGDLHEANLLKLDISKAESVLKWHPRWSARIAVEQTVEWYRRFYARTEDMHRFTLSQIERFESSPSPTG